MTMTGDGPEPDTAVGESKALGPRWTYKRYVITLVLGRDCFPFTFHHPPSLSLTFEPALDIAVSGID